MGGCEPLARTYLLPPILNIRVLHTGHVPSVAGRPFPLHEALAVFDLEFPPGAAPVDAARCQQAGTLADTNPAGPGLGVAAFDANECGRREDVGKILHRVAIPPGVLRGSADRSGRAC